MEPSALLQYGANGILLFVLWGVYKLVSKLVTRAVASMDAQTTLLSEMAKNMELDRLKAGRRHRILMKYITNGHNSEDEEDHEDERKVRHGS